MLQGTTTYINITSPHLLQTTLKYFWLTLCTNTNCFHVSFHHWS
jgi:hypothetical protein